MEPHGATFKLIDSHWLIENLLATDVDFGHDGKLYVTDWVDGWNGPGKGRIYTFAAESEQGAITAAGTEELFSVGFSQRSADELATLLGHADRRVRQAAQFALADAVDVATLTRIATGATSALPRVHAIWGLWQIARHAPTVEVAATLHTLAGDGDAEIRARPAACSEIFATRGHSKC